MEVGDDSIAVLLSELDRYVEVVGAKGRYRRSSG
jgi:hypothetical protein